ncbi:MAG: succinylglutamate desuccinylase/aspartoacylase family protein [Burkholderiales bacterium]|nr:succinylglutamate desuccinylase/aspartoacylase family protein [Anaerolineae bacterium]
MTNNLLNAIRWQHFPIGASAAVGHVNLSVGEIGNGGPTALISAGVHGDEGPWGAWAIRKLLERLTPDQLIGTLRIVPVANPLAMEADARNAPLDVLDLNRVFPGDPNGSHTERLAAALVANAVNGADVVIDLHGGGSWCVNAFAFQFAGGEDLAQAFHAPFLVTGPDRSVTLTGYARSQGARVAAIEQGGRSELEEQWAERIATGLRRALGVAGVLTPLEDDMIPAESIAVRPSKVLRPSSGGVFIPQVRASSVGTIVPGGTVLGHLLDPVTQAIIETFEAPFERTALMLLRPFAARIEGGAMTYVVAEPMS